MNLRRTSRLKTPAFSVDSHNSSEQFHVDFTSDNVKPQSEKAMNQEDLHTEKIIADRKIFFLDLKENARGRVVKITEDVNGNRDTIMVPAEILGDFIEALTDIKETADNQEEE
ncbi:MAG: hypothetical protein ACJAT6_000588 [Akkermansiaceae bacterium]|jgi:hypothetical protein|nr:hypothetical protein [Akkermansiaceae bacterium]